ncbi:hypothetical protein EV702DRAFT_1248955 [Suillus placidus]|uniref:Uncharacterized protein n=1 Tax=Suillus placidus TaxID=48579 RepID=A0A9P6ZLY2_9AGAM|nr:hypothetical protein EV702DRAFT_1248955 [Suillus placidus]
MAIRDAPRHTIHAPASPQPSPPLPPDPPPPSRIPPAAPILLRQQPAPCANAQRTPTKAGAARTNADGTQEEEKEAYKQVARAMHMRKPNEGAGERAKATHLPTRAGQSGCHQAHFEFTVVSIPFTHPRSMVNLTRHTRICVPLTPYLLPIISSTLTASGKPKSSTLRPLDMETHIRAPAQFTSSQSSHTISHPPALAFSPTLAFSLDLSSSPVLAIAKLFPHAEALGNVFAVALSAHAIHRLLNGPSPRTCTKFG